MDEPTTGLDPETKRRTWDVIKSIDKQHTSILLSTHDMAEADVLADHIAIMANGKVIFSGSATFLKKTCRVGYNVVLEKQEGFKLRHVLAIVKKAVPEADVTNEKKHEVTISLNTFETRNFETMFKELAEAKKSLGIASTSVTIATMKDVYLKYVYHYHATFLFVYVNVGQWGLSADTVRMHSIRITKSFSCRIFS
ncbi:hypothetical protein HPB48_021900 [Haemaphysalis longicornis]|uniref:Uncharacterized protein n=1 Tax=Haemaphysalis longicornis TaxID=44386 RepID=A0A9J6GJ69_HAELO|nr:hypothetical protein HPB48_021900 [Haemaphysalis longicornis]